ncbi:hypothetical protein N7478_000099 [Penicillium angulare]|uniref:uncharacterized protein n=1 Tax=Penicillium angulare TaxID=116970 RepID=UPI0025404CD8|nr:uncharacterized protein N7478_000099 [Penicillium angulare]KAJ5290848.1 hypothetical protein N7478_000099 [Penicillium angulare]
MSRNFITAAVTIGVGVFTGYYAFQPALQELAIQRAHGIQPGASSEASTSKQNDNAPLSNAAASAPQPSEPKKGK